MIKQRGARDVKHIGCELRVKPRQRKVKASPSIPKGGAAFKEKLTTPLSHIFSFDPLNNLQGQLLLFFPLCRSETTDVCV